MESVVHKFIFSFDILPNAAPFVAETIASPHVIPTSLPPSLPPPPPSLYPSLPPSLRLSRLASLCNLIVAERLQPPGQQQGGFAQGGVPQQVNL